WVIGCPSGSRVVSAAKFLPLARARTPSSSTGPSRSRRWVGGRLPALCRQYPGPELAGVEQGRSLGVQPGQDLGPLGRGHEGDDVTRARLGGQGLEGGPLPRVGRGGGCPDR